VTSTPFRRATTVAIAVLALVACGKRGSPVPPQVRFPEAVADLTAVARAGGVDLAWTPPRRRVDGTRLFDPDHARVFRVDDSGAGEPRSALRVGDRIAGYNEIASIRLKDPPAAEVQGGRVRYTDRRDLTPGRRYTYVVATTDERGRMSAPSTRVSVTYIAPPEAPGGLQAEPGDGEARLAWQAPARLADGTPVAEPLTYEILRAPDPATAPAVVGRTGPGETSFVDRGLTNDRTYQYAVRAVRREGAASVTGTPSSPVAVTPVKTTPPEPPSALSAIPSRGEVRLSWTPSPAPDIASYVVYRATPAGEFLRVGSVKPPGSAFVDRNVPPGRYRYAVTAQDTSTRANESARSNEVAVSVP
jgi:fibronectin type 3 domain-containing protein